jgi:hypothetical protein
MRVAMAALFALTLVGGPAAAPPVVKASGPLVNVTIGDIQTGDILSNNTVELNVAADIAVNVCGLQTQAVFVAEEIVQTGWFDCQNEQRVFHGARVDP